VRMGREPGAQPFRSDEAGFIRAELAEWKYFREAPVVSYKNLRATRI
jgi:hypothetical protein